MALAIVKTADGYLVNKHVLLANDQVPNSSYIVLAPRIGEDMQYGNHDLSYIEYPGEYDIKGIFIYAFAGKGDELNYLVKDGNHTYAFVQTEDALSNEECTADIWLFTNPHIAKTIDKMELEGEKIDLTMIE